MQKAVRLVLGSLFFVAHPALAVSPTMLTGAWEDATKSERGAITVIITKNDRARIEGLVYLTGSKDCVKPIPFRGTSSSGRFTAIADTPGICGGNGKLTAEVTKVGTEETGDAPYYIGTFSYRWIGVTWKKGTIQLTKSDESLP